MILRNKKSKWMIKDIKKKSLNKNSVRDFLTFFTASLTFWLFFCDIFVRDFFRVISPSVKDQWMDLSVRAFSANFKRNINIFFFVRRTPTFFVWFLRKTSNSNFYFYQLLIFNWLWAGRDFLTHFWIKKVFVTLILLSFFGDV